MSRTPSKGFTGIGRWSAAVFAILLSGIALGAPGMASADDCAALGGTLGAECVISSASSPAPGTYTIAETLHFTSGGKISVVGAAGLTINITAGNFVMDNNTSISAVTSTQSTSNGAPITIKLTSGNVSMATGSQITSNGRQGGFIQITSGPLGTIDIDGLVESNGTNSGAGANPAPGGGPISIIAGCALTISDTGEVISHGADPGADLVHLQGCTVTVNGLVESSGPGHSVPNNPPNSCSDVTPAPGSVRRNPVTRPGKPQESTGCVEIWSGTTLVIDSTGTHKGEVNADVGFAGGTKGIGWIDLFANGDININDGAGNGINVFAVHANGGIAQTTDTGGLITIKSILGSIAATGNAIEADAFGNGGVGGQIFVEANKNITFDGGTLSAHGAGASGGGGIIGSLTVPVRAYTGFLHWTTGLGNVLPGTTGQINLKACVGPTLGATFLPPTAVNVLAPSCVNNGPTLPAYAVNGFPSANCVNQCTLVQTGKSGTKFNDLVGNGIPPFVQTLPNWTFVFFDFPGNNQVGSALSNASGVYSITLNPGTYTVCEVLEPGWTQTFPKLGPANIVSCAGLSSPLGPLAPLGYRFTLVNSVETGNDFANHFTPPVCRQDPSVNKCDWTVDVKAPHDGSCAATTICPQLADPTDPANSAYPHATNGQVICVQATSSTTPPLKLTENSVLDGDKTLKITQCSTALITARDNAKPAITITDTGMLTIVGLETTGGSIGWSVEKGSHELKSIRATNATTTGVVLGSDGNTLSVNSVSGNGSTVSDAGILITGSNNTLRSGGSISGNCGDGIRIDGATNTSVQGNQSNGNTGNGLNVLANASGTLLDSDKANTNGASVAKCASQCSAGNPDCGNGFRVLGAATLKGNQSNQSSQGGKSENTKCEYLLGSSVIDAGGNKKDNQSFIGTIPPPPVRKYVAGCYE